MELMELVSPHVALPVIGVVICAIMVFTFGFRSPVQPPSFSSFEEEESKRLKRKPKQTKVKSATNGQLVNSEQASDDSKATPRGRKEAARQKVGDGKVAARKEVKADRKEKTTEKARKVSARSEGAQEVSASVVRKEKEEDGEWTTIAVTKKGKKQKSAGKKEAGQAGPAVESENEPEVVQVSASAAAAAAAASSEVEEQSTPQPQRVKKKKKVPAQARPDEKDEAAQASVVEKSAAPVSAGNQEWSESKKKKRREAKRPAQDAGAAASGSESLPQGAAPASAKSFKKEAAQPEPKVVEEAKLSGRKKKSKAKETTEAAPEANEPKPTSPLSREPKPTSPLSREPKPTSPLSREPKPTSPLSREPKPTSPLSREPKPTSPLSRESRKAQSAPEKKEAQPSSSPAKDTTKPTPAGKKSAKKSADLGSKDSAPTQAAPKPESAASAKESKAEAAKSSKAAKGQGEAAPKPAKEESTRPVKPTKLAKEESTPAPAKTEAAPAQASVSFDEMGDAWTEAAPKSKKKKPRRDN